ncbi:S1-C subfamily serine protease [Rhodococcus sp. OK519]|uniref:S1C family serine protease n=1 Tax=Rhodococcus sp. OK519 TaxID=2135729 RepID=UPI000D3896A0|nr:S1-C subfamily serine protease [Rhodococcus sp. OK519]
MSASGVRRASAAIAVLAAAGLALLAIPLEHGTTDASAPVQVTAPVVAPPPPPPPAVPLAPQQIAERVIPTIVTITTRSAFGATAGTGIVLRPTDSAAVVLTNHHVIDGGLEISAKSMRDGTPYPAEVLGYDNSRDLAVLRLPGAAALPPAVLGSSQTARVGDPVTAIGNAEGGGVPQSAPGAVTKLGVTVLTRNSADGSRNELAGLIEVNADVRPGDSGGPLVNAFGEVIGVSSAGNAVERDTPSAPAPQSYAIPIDSAMGVVDQILAGRTSDSVHIGPTPQLGVSVRDHIDAQAGTPSGAQVVLVSVRSPAEGLGLLRGDVIVEFDGAAIRTAADLTLRMIARHPGDRVDVRWVDAAGAQRMGSMVLTEGPPR